MENGIQWNFRNYAELVTLHAEKGLQMVARIQECCKQ